MPLGRRLQARRVSSDFRALVDRGTARVHLAAVGMNGQNGTMGCQTGGILRGICTGGWGTSPRCTPGRRLASTYPSRREVLVQMMMGYLRNNGSYFNLILLRETARRASWRSSPTKALERMTRDGRTRRPT